jgi:outer membrane protein assembly factor BamA
MTPLAACLAALAAVSTQTTVRFEGNRSIPDGVLQSVLDGDLRSVLTDEGLRRDAQWVLSVYYDRGFIEATVKEERETSADGAIVTGVFHIHEGPIYKLGRLELVGDRDRLAPPLPRRGSVFDRGVIVRALEQIRSAYRERGLEPLVTPVTSIDKQARTIDLRIEIAFDRG